MSFRLWRLLRSQAFGGLGCRLREGFTAKEARLVAVGAKAENVWLCAPCFGVVCTYVLVSPGIDRDPKPCEDEDYKGKIREGFTPPPPFRQLLV